MILFLGKSRTTADSELPQQFRFPLSPMAQTPSFPIATLAIAVLETLKPGKTVIEWICFSSPQQRSAPSFSTPHIVPEPRIKRLKEVLLKDGLLYQQRGELSHVVTHVKVDPTLIRDC